MGILIDENHIKIGLFWELRGIVSGPSWEDRNISDSKRKNII